MTHPNRARAREIQNAIREILNREWDPIDVVEYGPQDEYDAYIGRIYRLLTQQPAIESIETLLGSFEATEMECPSSQNKRRRTAQALLSLDIEL